MPPNRPEAAAPSASTAEVPAAPVAPASMRLGEEASRHRLGRSLGGVLLVPVVLGGALYGGNVLGIRDRIMPVPKLPTPQARGATSAPGRPPVLASYPWWQGVTSLQGSGAQSPSVTIATTALQWRAQWSCQASGPLSVAVRASGATTRPLIKGACPGNGTAFATSAGPVTLEVDASGPWRLQVDQQVDTPYVEPPLPAMTAPGATAVLRGVFRAIDQQGSGQVTIYRTADGSYALRLADFYVTPNTGLQIQLSSAASPQSDDDVTRSTVVAVADMNQTAGSMNFALPKGIQPTGFRSVVIWCLQLKTAYSAADLGPAQ